MKLFCVVTSLLAVATAVPDGPGHHGHHGAHHAAHHGENTHNKHHAPAPHTQHAHPAQPLKRQPLRRRPQVNPNIFKRNPVFRAQQHRLPHVPRPVRGLHNNLPVRPPQHIPHAQHRPQKRPNINTIPAAPTKAPVVKLVPAGKTIATLIAENPHFSTLHTALKAADLMSTLDGEGPFTVFAPTNSAFDKVSSIENL